MVLSLHKQPFVTAHFQFITAHFVRHCALKMPWSDVIHELIERGWRGSAWAPTHPATLHYSLRQPLIDYSISSQGACDNPPPLMQGQGLHLSVCRGMKPPPQSPPLVHPATPTSHLLLFETRMCNLLLLAVVLKQPAPSMSPLFIPNLTTVTRCTLRLKSIAHTQNWLSLAHLKKSEKKTHRSYLSVNIAQFFVSDVFLKSNTIVAELNNWFIANKLSLNVDKTC